MSKLYEHIGLNLDQNFREKMTWIERENLRGKKTWIGKENFYRKKRHV